MALSSQSLWTPPWPLHDMFHNPETSMNNYNIKKNRSEKLFTLRFVVWLWVKSLNVQLKPRQGPVHDVTHTFSWWTTQLKGQCYFPLILPRSRNNPLWKARLNKINTWRILRNGGNFFLHFLPLLPKILERIVTSTAAKGKVFSLDPWLILSFISMDFLPLSSYD